MRQFAWYSPEFDTIILQTFFKNCHIGFEWGPNDLSWATLNYGSNEDFLQKTLWLPLGEI